MEMTDELTIAAALYARTDIILTQLGFTAALVDWGLPYEAPDKLGNPADDAANVPQTIEVRHFRNSPTSPNWDSGTEFLGIWQITVIDYRQLGPFGPLAVCQQIVAAFDKDAQGRDCEIWHGSTRLQITGKPAILSVIEEQHRALYPVSIPYRCSV